MASDEDFYKREEDRKWREKVDHIQVTLVTSDQVQNDRLKRLERMIEKLSRAILGDPDSDTDGAVSRLHQQENAINLLKAVVMKDSAGNNGLVGRVEALETGERTSEFRWKTVIAILGWLSAASVAVIYNADRIAVLARHLVRSPDATAAAAPKKKSGSKHRRRPPPVQEAPDEPATEEVP